MHSSRKDLEQAIINIETEKAIELCKKILAEGEPVGSIIDSISSAMEVVGSRYQEGSYFLPELIASGALVEDTLKIVDKYHKRSEDEYNAKMLLATVKGDLHDIGKNIFGMFLKSTGFRVYDLGIDVSSEKIIEALEEINPRILGLSSLLTTSALEINNVVEALKRSHLREGLKIIIGGAGVNEEVARKSGVDGYARTAIEGMRICKEWLRK